MKHTPEEMLVTIGAAWDTYKKGYLSWHGFADVINQYDTDIDILANKLLIISNSNSSDTTL